MSEEWTSHTLDEIMFDMQRMTRERERAQARAQEYPNSLGWTMEDVDALLGLDDPLAGISAYPQETPPVPEKAEENDVVPAQVDPAPKPDEQATRRVPDLSAATEDEQPAKRVPDAAAPMPDAQATSRVPDLSAAAAEEQATKPVPDLSAARDGTAQAGGKPHSSPASRLLRGKKSKTSKPSDPEVVEGQIMLQGFETEDTAQELDEEQAAQELSARRSEQVRDFRLYDFAKKYEPDLPPKSDIFDEDEDETAPTAEAPETAPEPAREYRRFDERMKVGRYLQENRRNAFWALCGLLALEIVLIVISIVTAATEPASRSVLYAINLVLTAGAAALSISTMSAGAMDLLRWTPSCDSAALITVAASLIHGVVALLLPDHDGIPCAFGAAAVMLLLFSKGAKLFESIGILGNFKFCAFTAADHLHEIRPFADKKDTFEIAQNLDQEQPQLRYSGKTKFPADFLHHSDFRSTVDKLCKFILPAAFGAALLAAVFGWISTQTPLSALTAFTGAICIAMPAGAALTVSVPTVILMQRLNRHGGMIASPAAASANADLDAVAMDATDLYDEKECSIDCYQAFYSIRFDDMFLYAASLVINAHGPLENAFLEIVGNTDILLPVRSLMFEERLGISALIRGQNVLLGNRNLLLSHSVEAPAKSVEIPYLQEGKRILYLAVGNKVTTMFVVNYIENDVLAKPLQILHNNETDLVVYAADCNLTEEFLCEGFDLPNGSVRSMSPKAGELLRARCAEETDSAPAMLLHNGKAESLLYTLADAAVIRNIQRIASFVCIAGCVIGWLVACILMLLKGVGVVNWAFATIYTLLWTAVSTALGILQVRKA